MAKSTITHLQICLSYRLLELEFELLTVDEAFAANPCVWGIPWLVFDRAYQQVSLLWGFFFFFIGRNTIKLPSRLFFFFFSCVSLRNQPHNCWHFGAACVSLACRKIALTAGSVSFWLPGGRNVTWKLESICETIVRIVSCDLKISHVIQVSQLY